MLLWTLDLHKPVIPVATFLTPLVEIFSSQNDQQAVLSQFLCVLNTKIKQVFALLLYARFLPSLSWPSDTYVSWQTYRKVKLPVWQCSRNENVQVSARRASDTTAVSIKVLYGTPDISYEDDCYYRVVLRRTIFESKPVKSLRAILVDPKVKFASFLQIYNIVYSNKNLHC